MGDQLSAFFESLIGSDSEINPSKDQEPEDDTAIKNNWDPPSRVVSIMTDDANRMKGPLHRYLTDEEYKQKILEYEEMLRAFEFRPLSTQSIPVQSPTLGPIRQSVSTDLSRESEAFRVTKLSMDSFVGQLIREYFDNSKVSHHNVHLRINQVWEVTNLEQNLKFIQKNYDKIDNYLLWHGTKRNNLVSILQNNLRLPQHHGMFGRGIYFADRMTKSAQYTNPSGPVVLMLCQVALGNRYRSHSRWTVNNQLPSTYDSLEAIGKNVPDVAGTKHLGECLVPCGPTVANRDPKARLFHNEYIVFDPDRVQIMFILQCDHYKPAIAESPAQTNASIVTTATLANTVEAKADLLQDQSVSTTSGLGLPFLSNSITNVMTFDMQENPN